MAGPLAAAATAAAAHQQQQQQQDAQDGLGQPLLSVAPMMEWTDVHFRQLARLISRRTWLWTEMVVDKTILHTAGSLRDKQLWFPPEQRPLVLQLGGSDPALLRPAAAAAAAYGYDEINLNCGCPSDRVAGAGCFGASLMLQPQLVADCMLAIAQGLQDAAVAADAAGAAADAAGAADAAAGAGDTAGAGPAGRAPPPPRLSVKCRLGVDDADSYAQLAEFVRVVSGRGGVRHFVVHARKCLLAGLSPAQNRSVPPLRHDWVWALKRDFPHLCFQLNGGVATTLAAAQALALPPEATFGVGPGALAGVMVGRAAYHDPWGVLGDADVAVFGAAANGAASRRQVVEEYCKYADAMLGRWRTRDDGSQDPNVRTLVRPLLNLFHGERGGKRWKCDVDAALRELRPATVTALMQATLAAIPDDVLDEPPRPPAARSRRRTRWRPPGWRRRRTARAARGSRGPTGPGGGAARRRARRRRARRPRLQRQQQRRARTTATAIAAAATAAMAATAAGTAAAKASSSWSHSSWRWSSSRRCRA